MRIVISAGEASGEMYGAQLLEALRRHDPVLESFGVGGDRMRAAGCDTIIDTKDLAVVGITEILSHLPKILELYRKLIREADRRRPDLAVVIDSPAFNWRVARQMRKRGIPVVYYVCPQFWAWRQGRVKLLRKYVNQALCIFPFEEQFFRSHGVNATFVGHPLASVPAPAISRDEYAEQNSLDFLKPWITLMPGSRRKEVVTILPTLVEVAARLGSDFEYLLPVAPTLERSFLATYLGSSGIKLVPESLPALCLSQAAVVASGTATVEAALMNTPFVMVYRVTDLTYALGRSRIKVPHLCMVNLIAGERIVPELVQNDFTAGNVTRHIEPLLSETPDRKAMIDGLARVRALLQGSDTSRSAPERAAEIILSMSR